METNYQHIKNNFLEELKAASKNKKSSLSYIRNQLSTKPLVTQGTVQAIIVGGTNYISALAKVENGNSKVQNIKKGKLPVFKTSQDFSTFLEKILNKDAKALGINFAFPLLPTSGLLGKLDGSLIKSVKEHKFVGLVGKRVGEFIQKLYFKKYKNFIPVTVANDTVCLTLADQGSADGAMVVGTGFNMSLKLNEKGKKMIVNLEAGDFNGFEISETLKKIDEASEDPGSMMFEKIVSGKYLVLYFNEEAKKLGLRLPLLKSTEELSMLASAKTKTRGRDLARAILEQAANLVAAAVAGSYEFMGRPSKFELITEGSLFWKGYKYKENVNKQLLKLGIRKNAIKFKFVEDSSLKGALGLLIN